MWCSKTIEDVRKELNTNLEMGLNQKEAEKRLSEHGLNEIEDKKKENIIIKFLKQFNDFMIIILIATSIISVITAKIQGTNDYMDSIIIIFIVMFNAIMGLIQENRAEKSIEALKKMSSPTATVRRDGKIKRINGSEVVVGDVIMLEAGEYVPADCRLIKASNLQIEESALTGETVPILKNANEIFNEDIPIGDMKNCAFATTVIVNGHAEAIVTDIGMNTKVEKNAKMIISNEAPETPIQKKLEEVGKTLGVACLVICFIIFVIGIQKKISILEMFMTSIGLAVAAIPEGLPAIVTIMLSIGVTKMAKRNAIIRRLPAVETLGSSSVICSDKTGTLTQNKMQVVETSFTDNKDNEFLLELGCMCTDCIINNENEKIEITGDATEVAIVNAALRIGKSRNMLYSKMKRVNDIPFDSDRKLMTTIHKIGNKYRVITKGAPDVMIKICNKYYSNEKIEELTNSKIKSIIMQNEKMSEKALRVLGVAYIDLDYLPSRINSETIEKNLIFVGLIGMIDPPREGVREAILNCKRAGIKTVMITGDHILTAKAIAKDLGILSLNDLAITGKELDKIDQTELEKNIMRYSVFARVSPEHKVKIVEAYRKSGAVVAMTGDGVNDAPALKKADIGVSMGLNGTDVAKNASDMILTDDNFVTIVEAVKQGRNIFDNIIKALHFLLATNVGEIVTIFLGLLFGFETPLLAIQLLWINLVTDSLPAIALGLEAEESDIMRRKPRNPRKSIFADGLWNKIFVEGIMIGCLTLLAFTIGNLRFGLKVGRTMAFISLGMLELVHSLNVKSNKSIFSKGFFENIYLIGAFVLCTFLQIIIVFIPQTAEIFKLVSLNKIQWLYTLGISLVPLVVAEIQKAFEWKKSGKVVYHY